MTTSEPQPEKTFFGHPRGLSTLFMTELWERFSYYGMRALLALFLADSVTDGGLGLSQDTANAIVGVYLGMVYLTALPGGWLADRVFGPRRAIFIGGVIIMLGHISMAIPGGAGFVYLGLALIVAGTGLLKPNISAMVGHLYDGEPESRRDAGFSIFYMGINIGSLAPFIVGWLGQNVNYHLGFACAALGMAIGLIQYVWGGKYLRGIGANPSNPLSPAEKRRVLQWLAMAAAALAIIALAAWLLGVLDLDAVTFFLTLVAIVVPIAYFAYILKGKHGLTPDERSKMTAYIWLFLAAAVFWMIYDQAATTLTNFAATETDLSIFGWEMPSSWTQNINPIFIIVLAPVFAGIWTRAGTRVSTPFKFAIGLTMAGLSFVAMSVAASVAEGGTKVSILWLVLVYLIQTIGELCLSPVGLSVTTRLAPAAFSSQMLGVWFLATAMGDSIGGQVARLSDGGTSPAYYLWSGLFAIAVGALLFAFVPKVRRLMNEHHENDAALIAKEGP
ncbi:peptide MFS transporter [Actinocorallia longicatena]|uniref:MFS transporter n=1 Tax=Actinocorallia longicatena TaxID=111803 RepID=A0ABP6Q6B4_9ACTN